MVNSAKPRVREILPWVIRGKSITRAMLNIQLQRYAGIEGTIVDLGGGKPSYLKILAPKGSFLNMDRVMAAQPDFVGDLEKTVPIRDNSADAVLLINALEHVYNFQHVADEMCRILKKDGLGLVFVPFLVGYHTHSTKNFLIDDYFRYSKSALQHVFAQSGFCKIQISPMGGLFWVIADLLNVAARFVVLRLPVTLLCGLIEWSAMRFRNFDSQGKYPLAYFIELRK